MSYAVICLNTNEWLMEFDDLGDAETWYLDTQIDGPRVLVEVLRSTDDPVKEQPA